MAEKKDFKKPVSDDRLDEMLEDASREAAKRGESDIPHGAKKDKVSKAKAQRGKAESKHGPVITVKLCECGCGSKVKRRFLSGHDMKLKSVLLKAMKKGNAEAEKELKSRGWA